MYVYDSKELRILDVNHAALQKYGYSRDEFLRLNIGEIRIPEETAALPKRGRTAAKALAVEGCERHRRKDGDVFDVEVTTQSVCFEGREAILAVARDIGARRSAERHAAEQNAYLHAVMDNNPLAIVALDTKRRIQMCNSALEQLFGHRSADILGKKLEDLVVSERKSAATAFMDRALAGETVRVALKIPRRDGSTVDVRIVGVPLIIDGERRGSIALYEDITEQCRADEARRQAEEKYRRLVDNAVEGIFEAVRDRGLVAVNPAMARIAGYSSPEEMMAAVPSVRHLYADPRDFEALKRKLKEQGGVVEGFECQMLRKDGSKVWISLNVRVLPGENGRSRVVDGSVVDITGRKRSELERFTSMEIMRSVTLTDNLDDLLRVIHTALNKVVDAQNCFVALYDPAADVFQFPYHVDKFDALPTPQRMARSCTDYVFRTGAPLLLSRERFCELVARGEVEQIGTLSSSWLGVPLRTPAATIGVLVVQHYEREGAYTHRDLEFLSSVGGQIALAIERKRAEGRMREGEARLRVLVEQLPAILWTVDKDLRFTSSLGAGLAHLDLQPNQLVGVRLHQYYETSDDNFAPIAAHRQAIAGQPSTYQIEWKGNSYACHVEPLRDAAGNIQGAVGMALDVTDRKRLEEQFRQSQKMEAVGRLAGGVAHDFNNLLMVIQGYADMLSERLPPNDSLSRSAEQIQTAARRAASLIRQLLAFSRKQVLAPTVLNLHSIVAEMEKILRRLIGEDVNLDVYSPSDLWLVKVDRSQAEQVILNLAINARDAMPNGGRLTIETANVEVDDGERYPDSPAPGEYVMLAVTDNGTGMDEQTRAHIFEPFFTTKEKGKGTGLGLATVYGIVKQSGGYVWVYSEVGRGSTFKIYLPRTEETAAPTISDSQIEAAALPRGSEVVLLVEDEKGVRDLAREYLETIGYKVLEAPSSHIAIELASMHNGRIDVLLTDVVMPGIGGRELSARISAVRPDIKVLYMSGYTDQTVVHQRLLDHQAVFLQKPFTLASLATKLREVLAANAVV